MKNAILLIGFLVLWSCNDPESPTYPISEGTYTGSFSRTSSNTVSEVTLTFENGTFSGSSETTKYPAICNGTYTAQSGRINFENSCFWTAEFDWSLILNGEYEFTFDGFDLTILRKYPDFTDRYELTKNPE